MGANNEDFGLGAQHARLGLLGTQSNDPRYAGLGGQTNEFEGSNHVESDNEDEFAGNAGKHIASNGTQ